MNNNTQRGIKANMRGKRWKNVVNNIILEKGEGQKYNILGKSYTPIYTAMVHQNKLFLRHLYVALLGENVMQIW